MPPGPVRHLLHRPFGAPDGTPVNKTVQRAPASRVTPACPHPSYRVATPQGDLATVDLFRVDGGMIVEHWDVVQPISGQMLHPHRMF